MSPCVHKMASDILLSEEKKKKKKQKKPLLEICFLLINVIISPAPTIII